MKINALDIAQKISNGDKLALSKAITWTESSKNIHRQLSQKILDNLQPIRHKTVRIGITGVPGAGKSTFIEAFGTFLIQKGHKVAVLTIDPSSQKSKGSILGDKTRMEALSAMDSAYIRPSASGMTLGGLNSHTFESIQLCEAAGYDVIIIETVGVGQNEVEVKQVSDFFLFLALAGAGDELQGVKRGIMEMCHGIIVNKADGDNLPFAKRAQSQIQHALQFLPQHDFEWKTPVLLVSSTEKVGIENVWNKINSFIDLLDEHLGLETVRNEQKVHAFKAALKNVVWEHFNEKNKFEISQLEHDVKNQNKSIFSAINEITNRL